MARHKGYGGKSNVFSQGPRTIPIHQSPGALLGRPLTHKSKEVIISAISLPEDSGFTIRSAPNAQIFGLKDLGITLSEQPRFRDAAGFLAALLSETTIDATAARNSLYGVTVTGVRDRMNIYGMREVVLSVEDPPNPNYQRYLINAQIIGEIAAVAVLSGHGRRRLARAILDAQAAGLIAPPVDIILATGSPGHNGVMPNFEQLVPDSSLLPDTVDFGPLSLIPISKPTP